MRTETEAVPKKSNYLMPVSIFKYFIIDSNFRLKVKVTSYFHLSIFRSILEVKINFSGYLKMHIGNNEYQNQFKFINILLIWQIENLKKVKRVHTGA